MKKIFTLICALVGLAGAAQAASIDDVAVCKHSYVLVCDDVTNVGTIAPSKGQLFGDNFFIAAGTDATMSKATNKQKFNLAAQDEEGNYLYFDGKYAEYGEHYNSLRLKNAQGVIGMKVTAGSKVIVIGQIHSSRYPKIAEDASLNTVITAGETENNVPTNGIWSWVADDDRTIYIGSEGGDWYFSYVIVEANEAVGTPSVKVGPQTLGEDGLWFREVTVTPATVDGEKSIVTYSTEGAATAADPIYTAPIKCYKDQVIKFQGFMDMGDGVAYDEAVYVGADNEALVNFSFDAPAIKIDGAKVTIETAYANAKNYVSYLDQEDVETSEINLTESASITAYTKITNGSHTVFTSKQSFADALVLNPIKEKKTITVSGTAVVDEEATATSTTGTVYMIENGAITADKMDFFVKAIEFGAIATADPAVAKYQVPAGQEAYIKMNNTNITFQVAEGDSVDVVVVCSKNSCKSFDIPDPTGKDTANVHVAINVSGKTYGDWDITAGNPENLDGYKNVITFGLGAGTYTFQKFSGTGNIFISSIEITPAKAAVVADEHDNCLKVTNPEVKGDTYGTQLFYTLPAPMVKGTDYVMSMDVKFENDLAEDLGFWPYYHPVGVDAITQYTGFGESKFDAGEWKTIVCNFNATADHMFLQFPIGHVNGTMYIDNVKLVAKDSEENLVVNGTFDEAISHLVYSNYGNEGSIAPNTWWSWSWAAPAVETLGIESLTVVDAQPVKAQKVMINGQLVIKTAKGNFNVAGMRVK